MMRKRRWRIRCQSGKTYMSRIYTEGEEKFDDFPLLLNALEENPGANFVMRFPTDNESEVLLRGEFVEGIELINWKAEDE